MGIIIAKFRKKTSTYDVLTKLEKEIVCIEDFQKQTKQTQRKFIFRFILVAGAVYIIIALLLYLYFSQISQDQKLLWSIPLILVPFGVWIIKRLLTWYFNRKIKRNEKKLIALKEQKKKILENVMETETYKVAKKILDKFGNEPKQNTVTAVATPVLATPMPNKSIQRFDTVLRQRSAAQNAMRGRISFGGSPQRDQMLSSAITPMPPSAITPMPQRHLLVTPAGTPMLSRSPVPLARTILPKDRSVLDKMVDYLLGDGPSNRYALICQQCYGHNGMALKEDFEYISFRCSYCSHVNPSRKKRPIAPALEASAPLQRNGGSESSDSEKNSETDSEDEPKPLTNTESQGEGEVTQVEEDLNNLEESTEASEFDTEIVD